MKKLFLTLALLGSMCGFAAAEEPDAVRIKPVAGDEVVILFTANPEVTYTATGVTVSSTQDPVSFDFDDIEFIDFVRSSSVQEVAGTSVSMRVTPQALIIENAEPGSSLAVFALDGRSLLNTSIPDTSYSIDRSRLAKGVYIVRINKTTFKISL